MIDFTKITHDINGNPRYVTHFMNLLTENEKNSPAQEWAVGAKYALAVKRANKIGGRKFHNKQYGGGIVFQSYSTTDLERQIERVKELANARQLIESITPQRKVLHARLNELDKLGVLA